MKLRPSLLFATTAILCAGSPVQAKPNGQSPPLKPGESIAPIYGAHYLAAHGWRMPPPPYPELARQRREHGLVYLHLETDKTGQVVRTSVLRTPLNTDSKTLRQLGVLWTLYKWSGPPNASTNVAFEFRLSR